MAVSPDESSGSRAVRPGQRQVNRPKASLASGDGLLSAAQGVVNFVYDYRIAFLAVIVAIFAVAGAMSLWENHLKAQNAAGAEKVARITADLPGQDAAANIFGVSLGQKDLSDEDKAELVAAAEKLDEVAREFSAYPSGIIAGLERARLLTEAEKFEEAVAAYDALLQAHDDMNTAFRFRAMNGKADAQLKAGHSAEAVKTYQSLVESSKGVWREFALLALTAAQEEAGMKREAVSTLERFITEFPESSQLESAKTRLARLKGQSGVSTENNDSKTDNSASGE